MNNKKKWASILTIATSLILCIISTFGITLAFFGGNASANLSTITLKTGIEIGAAIESSVGSAKVVPGQPVKITATGTVSATELGSADANNAVDGVVRAKFNVGNELGTVTIAGNTTDFWTAGNDGYYYLVTAQDGTTLRTVSKGTSVQIFGDLVVSKNFTNADSGKSVEASVIFEVIQADIYKTDGTKETLTVTNATTSTSPLYSAFNAVKMEDKYNVTLHLSFNKYYSAQPSSTTLVFVKPDDNESTIINFSEGTVNFSANTLTFGLHGRDRELYRLVCSKYTYQISPNSITLGYGNSKNSNVIWEAYSLPEEVGSQDTGCKYMEGSSDFTLQLTQDAELWLDIYETWD